jgi:hypothetical protein
VQERELDLITKDAYFLNGCSIKKFLIGVYFDSTISKNKYYQNVAVNLFYIKHQQQALLAELNN